MNTKQSFSCHMHLFSIVIYTVLLKAVAGVTESNSTSGYNLTDSSLRGSESPVLSPGNITVTQTQRDSRNIHEKDNLPNAEGISSSSSLLSGLATRTQYENASYSPVMEDDSAPVKRVCTQKDSAGLNKCLHQLLEDLRPRLPRGIPEINLPSMEPLKLQHFAFEQGSGPVKIISQFTDVEVSGLSNFSQSDFWVDVPKKTMSFDLIFPQLSLVGTYTLSGNLFFIPVGGSGNFYLSLGGVRARGVSKLDVVRVATSAQVVVKKTDVNLEIDTIKVHLSNLFNGDEMLGTFINKFLNENSQEVFAEVKPQIGAQVGEMLSLLANRALSALSSSHFDEVPFSSDSSEEHSPRHQQ